MRLTDWVFHFIQGYRFEAGKLKPEETECFEPYVKEQMLAKPCQVEVIQFNKPCRVALFFFLDRSKQDLLIRVSQETWTNLQVVLSKLLRKYPDLQLRPKGLNRLLERSRGLGYSDSLIYGIDSIRDVCLIYFTHNVQRKALLFPWSPIYISGPQKLAEVIFNLNYSQAMDESASRSLFR